MNVTEAGLIKIKDENVWLKTRLGKGLMPHPEARQNEMICQPACACLACGHTYSGCLHVAPYA